MTCIFQSIHSPGKRRKPGRVRESESGQEKYVSACGVLSSVMNTK